MHVSPLLLVPFLAMAAPAQRAVETARVEGRVVDMRGEPVPSAKVWAVPWSDPERILVQGTTDGDGWFVLGKVPIGHEPWGIRATAPGRVIARVQAVPGPEPVQVQLPEAARCNGVLVNGKGEPVAGATVMAQLAFTRDLRGVRDLAVTDAQGRFEMAKVPLGLVWFTAVVPGEGMAGARPHVSGDCSVGLAPAGWPRTNVTVEVRGLPEGGPPPGACVSFETQSAIALPPPWDRMPLDRSGRCELNGVPPWVCVVTPWIPGYVSRPLCGSVTPSQPALVFDAVVPPAVLVPWQGEVRDRYGSAVSGVVLEARVGEVRRFLAETEAGGRWQFDLPVPIGTAVWVHCQAGDWVLDWAAPGQAVDQHLGCVFHSHVAQAVKPQLRVVRSCSVTGRVLADGGPAPRVVVTLEEEWSVGELKWRSVTNEVTDLNGNYRFRGVHPRKRKVRVSVDGALGAGTSESFTPQEEGLTVQADLTLRAPGVVEGELVDAFGKAAVGWQVWLRRDDRAAVEEVFTDKAGRFRFPSVQAGGVHLQVGRENKPVPMESFDLGAGGKRSFRLTIPK